MASAPPSAFVNSLPSARPRPSTGQPRPSTESWSSVEEDSTTYEWTPEHISVLVAILERPPSHLATPYAGAIPPSNLLDAMAREIIGARPAKSDWPHSSRATRLKLIQVAKRQARHAAKAQHQQAKAARQSLPSTPATPAGRGSNTDAMDVDEDAATSSNSRRVQRSAVPPILSSSHYDQNSMDITPIPEESVYPLPDISSSISRAPPITPRSTGHPSASQKLTPHASFHPYKRTPRNGSVKADEPSTPPSRHADTQPHPGSVRSETFVPTAGAGEGPASLSAASSATLLSSIASRASLTTAVSGTGSDGRSIPVTKTPRRTTTKTPKRGRIVEGGELSTDVFGVQPQGLLSPALAPAFPSLGNTTPGEGKRLRSRTISTSVASPDPAYGADTEARQLSSVAKAKRRPRASLSVRTPSQENPFAMSKGDPSSREPGTPNQSVHPSQLYGELYADDMLHSRTRTVSTTSAAAEASATSTPPSIRTVPSLVSEHASPMASLPLTPSSSRRGLRRVGKLSVPMSPSNSRGTNENLSPMQLSPSPSHGRYLRTKDCGGRPLSMMSATSDRSERSALSNISAHSGSVHSGFSGFSALSSRPPPSRAARMIGRKISFGSDHGNNGPSGLRLHHGTLGSPSRILANPSLNGSAAAIGDGAAMTMMTLAPAFELR
ncbi:hypothetical protein DL93DRAFT_2162755 [Clavulina sp. PMI_390]|nr:hypothetical protein DL93DRAFT_2162755 [Clavulina sp. PMI_390]